MRWRKVWFYAKGQNQRTDFTGNINIQPVTVENGLLQPLQRGLHPPHGQPTGELCRSLHKNPHEH